MSTIITKIASNPNGLRTVCVRKEQGNKMPAKVAKKKTAAKKAAPKKKVAKKSNVKKAKPKKAAPKKAAAKPKTKAKPKKK